MSARPDLSDEEVDKICAGLRQDAAKVRYLRQMGVRVLRRPNGRPLVARVEWERAMAAQQAAASAAATANEPRWRVPAGA